MATALVARSTTTSRVLLKARPTLALGYGSRSFRTSRTPLRPVISISSQDAQDPIVNILLAHSANLRAFQRSFPPSSFGNASRSLRTTRTPLKPAFPVSTQHVYGTGNFPNPKHGEAQTASAPEVHRPLKALSTTSLLRALVVHTVSDYDVLFKLSNKVVMSNLKALEKPGVMKWILDETFYKQFCGGSNAQEIRETVDGLKALGIKGVILTYAKEVDVGNAAGKASVEEEEIRQWREGSLKAVEFATDKDFVALKFSGAGQAAVELMAKPNSKLGDNKLLEDAVHEICTKARSKGVRLMVDAEHQGLQDGVDSWTMELMREFNREEDPCLYGTYQMYRRAAPAILAHHLDLAAKEGFSIGVKLVRGAYLATEPRETLCPSKTATDHQYNFAIFKLLTEAVNSTKLGLVVASHNRESCELATRLVEESKGRVRPGQVSYAQLHGMADELSLDLAGRGMVVHKYITFGTTAECAKYLMRRAEENREGAARSEESKRELNAEIRRRLLPFLA